MPSLTDTTLVILASTYPRWENDKVPGFVEDFARYMEPNFKAISVVSPHYQGARRREKRSETFHIRRFRYAYPYRFENLAYGEFKKSIFYSIKTAAYIMSEAFSTLSACLSARPVIINAHWLIPQGFVAIMLRPLLRCKVVISVHGSDVFTLNGKFMRKIKRFVLKRADRVIVNSSATQAASQSLYDRPYPIIPMGVNLDRFTPVSQKATTKKHFELLFVGRLVEGKGLRYLCEAMSMLKDKEHIHLTMVGDGPERSYIERYVRDHQLQKSIALSGWVHHSSLPRYYQEADVFIGPSIEHHDGWQEAFGTVFIEAAATAIPIIATNTGGIKDIVIDGLNGISVPQKSAEAISRAVESLANDRDFARRLGENGLHLVRSSFSWGAASARYIQIFKDL